MERARALISRDRLPGGEFLLFIDVVERARALISRDGLCLGLHDSETRSGHVSSFWRVVERARTLIFREEVGTRVTFYTTASGVLGR